MKRIVISSDHAGFELKQSLKQFLKDLGYQIEDVGTCSTEPVDYPELTRRAAEKVASGEYEKGIVFCGTGQGDAMVANKVPGVRAALCWDVFTAQMSRAHNNANVLVLGGWLVGQWLAREIIRVWLATPFDGGRHQRRIDQMMAIEQQAHTHYRKIYDITLTLSPGMAVWPGTPPIIIEPVKAIEQGDECNISLLHVSSHSGTHVDAPRHFNATGTGVDALNPGAFVGRAKVAQLPDSYRVDRRTLERLDLRGTTRLLIGTRNAALLKKRHFEPDYTYVTEDAARYLVECGIKLIGTDYLSLEEYQKKGHPAHHALLDAGVIVVEGLDLSDVPEGDYELLCLPTKLKDGDGAPARAILREL